MDFTSSDIFWKRETADYEICSVKLSEKVSLNLLLCSAAFGWILDMYRNYTDNIGTTTNFKHLVLWFLRLLEI
jgi:hypothetical protein